MPAQHQARHGPVLGRPRRVRWAVARNSWTSRGITASTSIAPRSGKRASAQRSRGCAKCLKTTTGTSRRPWQGNARARASGARGAHRPSARRSGEAPGVAATARRAQGRQAAEQGPAHEHANVGRRPITDLRALLADGWRHLRVGLRWPGNRLPLHGLGAPGHLGNMPQPYALRHRGVPMPRWERRLIAPPRAWVVSERSAHAVPWRQNRRTNLSSP